MAAEPAPPSPPPNLRVADDEARECEVCTYFARGRCTEYHNLPVDDEWTCDTFKKGSKSDTDDVSSPRTLKEARPVARGLFKAAREQ